MTGARSEAARMNLDLPDLASWSNGNIQRALGNVNANEDEGFRH